MSASRKTIIIGLDSASPRYVFGAPPERLPHTAQLRREGLWGELESCIPPITCPAWMCMATSQDPGQLGIYGFRDRADYSYDHLVPASTLTVGAPTLWEVLAAHGKRSVVIGVPGAYPPRPFDGWLVCSFLSPGPEGDYTYPKELRHEIEAEVPGYVIDVADFRTPNKDGLLTRVYEMTERRFALVEHMMTTRPWDLVWFVELGVDRLYHAFWRYAAQDHRLYEPGNRYEGVLLDYHAYLDERIGRLLGLAPDDTLVLVVSDHGARTLQGSVCVNEWLAREGYLSLRHMPPEPSELDRAWVDWDRTRAWAEGGYYARVFVNVHGREPAGCVEPSDYGAVCSELAARLEAMRDHEGRPMGNRAYRPAELYREVRGIAPDLIACFGDLGWRAAATVGHGAVHILDNDKGPDDANHAMHGVLIIRDPLDRARGEVHGASVYDIAPTVLDRLGLPIPAHMVGRPIGRGGVGC